MAEWYYVHDSQQVGPVTGSQLKSLAAAGTLGRDDLVWNESLPEWVPAGKIRGLSFASAASAAAPQRVAGPSRASAQPPAEASPFESAGDAPAPLDEATFAAPQAAEATAPSSAPMAAAQTVAYQSAAGESWPATSRTIDLLKQTRPWVLLFSVLMFIGAGFLVLGGMAVMFAASFIGKRGMAGLPIGMMFVISFIYIGMAALYVFPAIFLSRFSARIKALMRSGQTNDLESALEAQRSFWRFMGIATIIGIGLYIVIVIVSVAAGTFMH